ncbi:MAG TPA: ABC transporter substrate-binding protein [Pseudomonadota bacterium]|nr:ABC transporter substrate-binding protein [Pseudomonadota bacterium]
MKTYLSRRLWSGLLSLGLSLPLWLSGCTLAQKYTECSSDAECPMVNGQKLFCSSDQLCVLGRPKDQLCTEIYPANAPANSIAVGAIAFTEDGNDDLVIKAWKLGIDQVNERRSPDPPLALHICDVGKDENDAFKSMQLLARERHAVALVGPTTSGRTFAIKDELIRSGIPMMSPSATSPEISALGTQAGPVNSLFFRVVPSDSLQGPVLAKQIPVSPTPKVALLYVDDPYGTGLKDAFLAALPGLGLSSPTTVKYNEPAAGVDQASINAAAASILALNPKPDYLVAITNVYTVDVLKALTPLPTSGTPTTKIIMADGAKNDNTLKLSGTAYGSYNMAMVNAHLARISGTAPTVDTANQTKTGAYQKFVDDYKTRWNQQDPSISIFSAYGYDSIFAVAMAIGAAGADVTPARVSQMLSRINKIEASTGRCLADAIDTATNNWLVVGKTKYLDAKNKLTMRDQLVLQGATGTICFTPHGDRSAGLYERWSINPTAVPPRFDSVPAS